MNLLKEIENEQVAKLSAGREIPDFQPGDTVVVNVKILEGERSRVQAYEGVCIGRAGGGLNENFTVRKISYGEGVERVFPLYSPIIDSIKVVRRGKVRRAKLYYLRGRRGKSARIGERQDHLAEGGARRKAAKVRPSAVTAARILLSAPTAASRQDAPLRRAPRAWPRPIRRAGGHQDRSRCHRSRFRARPRWRSFAAAAQ